MPRNPHFVRAAQFLAEVKKSAEYSLRIGQNDEVAAEYMRVITMLSVHIALRPASVNE